MLVILNVRSTLIEVRGLHVQSVNNTYMVLHVHIVIVYVICIPNFSKIIFIHKQLLTIYNRNLNCML